jgi:hypothetical protein
MNNNYPRMKRFVPLILAAGAVMFLSNCNKNTTISPKAAGAINITNAVVDGATLTFSTNNSIAGSNNTIGNNAAATIPLTSGQTQFSLFVPAVAATLSSPAIPTVTYYTNTLTINGKSNYSLFLTGASTSSIDQVLIQEDYPFSYADSTCGVRFINLAPDTNPVSVDIQGNLNGSGVDSMAYKAYSNFIKHPAKAVNSTYTFEFRDATSGSLLTSFTLNTPYFHNVTLALNGTGGNYGVIQDNDF